MIARLVRSADFERVLRTRTRVNSIHFAVHHLADRPSLPAKALGSGVRAKLSTGSQQIANKPVDDSKHELVDVMPLSTLSGETSRNGTPAIWLGAVVPKRHARRSVTRSLIKRQIRAAVLGQAPLLAGGLWVVRLRAPFDRAQFVSAASDALKRVAHDELESLMRNAAQLSAAR